MRSNHLVPGDLQGLPCIERNVRLRTRDDMEVDEILGPYPPRAIEDRYERDTVYEPSPSRLRKYELILLGSLMLIAIFGCGLIYEGVSADIAIHCQEGGC